MMEIYERVKEIAEYYRVSKPSEFAKKTGFSHQVSSNYLKGNRNPTRESINTILVAFPEINSDWLLAGIGPMLKTKHQTPEIVEESKNTAEYFKMKTELLQELIKGKDELIEMLKEKLKEFESRKTNSHD